MVAVLILGETVLIFKSFIHNTGAYLSDLVYKSFNLYSYQKQDDWIGGWTILYWAWWIAWAPFVGIFIARISKGRTISQFMKGVLFIPAGFTFFWMTVFGNSAIDLILNKNEASLGEAINTNVATGLFKFFEFFPFGTFLSIVGVLLVTTFFVSSSDSGSLVIDTLASGGQEEPPVWQRVFWAVSEGIVAAVLLVAGGLDALQTMTIISAFPIMVVILVGSWGMLKELKNDYIFQETVKEQSLNVPFESSIGNWKSRLSDLVSNPQMKNVRDFLKTDALTALEVFKTELESNGIKSRLIQDDTSVSLTVLKQENVDFKYQIKIQNYDRPKLDFHKGNEHFRAEVFLHSGGQDYDVFGFSKGQIIADVFSQYEKHLQFIHRTYT